MAPDRRSLVHGFLFAAGVLLLTAPAPAQATPVSAAWGDTFVLDAKLGFSLSCPHTLEIVVENPSVCAPIDPPETTTKQSFKFEGLAVGLSQVTLSFTGTDPCPGFASKIFDVTIEPDADNTTAAFQKQGVDAGKAFKAAASAESKAFKAEVGAVRDTAQGGATPLATVLAQMSELAMVSSVHGTNALDLPLVTLSGQGSELLGVSGLAGAPRDFTTGCGGTWDTAVASQRSAFAGFQSGLTKDFGKSLKKLSKLNSNMKASLSLSAAWVAPPVEGPSIDAPFGTVLQPPRFTLGVGFLVEATTGLTIGGYADGTQGTVHMDLSGPNGYVNSIDDVVTTPNGDRFGHFSWSLGSTWTKAGAAGEGAADGEPALLDGLYRAEVRYAADTNPADVFYITVP